MNSASKPRKRPRTSGYGTTGTQNDIATTDSIPIRNIDKLFGCSATIHCALENRCVPCGYKLGCFDVALDTYFCKAVPNQRPECCPRAMAISEANNKRKHNVNSKKNTVGNVNGSVGTMKNGNLVLDGSAMGYRSGMRVLTVGDGDFSFSLAVARLLSSLSTPCCTSDNGNAKRKKKKVNLVATSYESIDTLRRVYPNFDATALELEALGAVLCYKVDATRLQETLPAKVVKKATKNNATKGFRRIVWNFPCTAIDQGQDGQNDAMENNKQLVRTFVEGARRLVARNGRGGEIHMCHKTKPPFNQWRIEEVAVELCQASEPPVSYTGRIVLDKCLLPPYQPRKALHPKSFPCHDACVYVFAVLSSLSSSSNDGSGDSDKATECTNSIKGTIPELPSEYSMTDNNSEANGKGVFPVTRSLVLSIRERLLVAEKSSARKKKQKNWRHERYR